MRARMWTLLVVTGLGALGCEEKDDLANERGSAPPPVASSRPGVCTSGGGVVADPATADFFPRSAGDYCVDPNGETRAYGKEAKGTLDEVCTQLFDGECEVYKSYGLERVVTLRYVDGKGSPGAVSVNLSRFASKGGAYGFFTKRVVADADPLEAAPAQLEAGGAGAIGTGIAYVWRGSYVAELSYTNELEPPAQLKSSSRRVLPPIARELGAKLPGDREPPPAVGLLPQADRVPMGVSYEPDDVLGIQGTGAGAVGYYRRGDQRWRVVAVTALDEAAAKDVFETFVKMEGSKKIDGLVFPARSFSVKADEGAPKVDWLVARKGARVLGVGDEELALGADATAEEAAKKSLSREQKLELLKSLGEAGQGAPTDGG